MAGLPLAADLFTTTPLAASSLSATAFARVLAAWERWRAFNPQQPSEQFMADIQGNRNGVGIDLWPAAVRFVAARLGEPEQARLEHELRYGERVTRPSPAAAHHALLQQVLAQYDLAGVVTTNYDLLAERTLGHRPMKRTPAPGFYYPGFDGSLIGTSTFSRRHSRVDLPGTAPLCKVHGSLNWAVEEGRLRYYADCRPAHRRYNISHIVPPGRKDEPDRYLAPVWTAAAELLTRSEHWIVVGYSAPPYDTGMEGLLRESAERGVLRHVTVVDRARAVASRYENITGRPAAWAGPLDNNLGPAQQDSRDKDKQR